MRQAPDWAEGLDAVRLLTVHASKGLEFRAVYLPQLGQGAFPARQKRRASEAVARGHGLDPSRSFFVQQSPEAIAAGAFHNDVVAVANERVLFAHEQAFADRQALYDFVARNVYDAAIVEELRRTDKSPGGGSGQRRGNPRLGMPADHPA